MINLKKFKRKRFSIPISLLLIFGVAFIVLPNSWLSGLLDSTPRELVKLKEHNFKGSVIIVGAGAAGLGAANILEKHGFDYRIIEASNRYGGRVKKDTSLADVPLNLGAEYIHREKDILTRLIGKEEDGKIDQKVVPALMSDSYIWGDFGFIKIPDFLFGLKNWLATEYQYIGSTWFDYLENNFARYVEDKIIYNAPATEIDYSGNQVVVTTKSGVSYLADKVIVTVSAGVLQAGHIKFKPALSAAKTDAINSVVLPVGFKLFMKFNETFYPAGILLTTDELGTMSGYYDAAKHKGEKDHVLALITQADNAERFYKLGSPDNIVAAVLKELDESFDGKASKTFTGEYVYKDWGNDPYVLGTWSIARPKGKALEDFNAPLQDKVYFAGEAYGTYGVTSTVPAAIMSGYAAVYDLLDGKL